MAHVVTGEHLTARTRERVGHAQLGAVSPAETLRYVNAAMGRWWHLLVANVDGYGGTRVRTTDMTFDDVNSIVVAPGVWRPRVVLAGDSASQSSTWQLERVELEDIGDLYRLTGGKPRWYTLASQVPTTGTALLVYPLGTPSAYEWEIHGIAPPPQFATAAATVDVWSALCEDLIVTYAAIEMRDREEVDASLLVRKAGELEALLVRTASPRDGGNPRMVRAARWDRGEGALPGDYPVRRWWP